MARRDVHLTYFKYKCPNRIHLFALLGDTETCIYCFVEDNPPQKNQDTGSDLLTENSKPSAGHSEAQDTTNLSEESTGQPKENT